MASQPAQAGRTRAMMACQALGSLQRACEDRDGYSFIGRKLRLFLCLAPIDAAVLKNLFF
jgi:hypothetical protein